LVSSAAGFRFPIRSITPELLADLLPANISIPGLDLNKTTMLTTEVPSTVSESSETKSEAVSSTTTDKPVEEELDQVLPINEIDGNFVVHGPLISKRSQVGSEPKLSSTSTSIAAIEPSEPMELTARSLVLAAAKSALAVFKGVVKLFLKPIKLFVKLGLKVWKLFGGGKLGKLVTPFLAQTAAQLPYAGHVGHFVRQNPAIVSSISQLLEF